MPRTNIPVQVVPPFGGGIQAVTKTAGDSANGHEFINDGNTRLWIQNLDASSKTATVVSVTDEYGRTLDTVNVVPAASAGDPGIGTAGPFRSNLWGQRGAADIGKVFVNLSAATSVKLWAVSG
jgi:hypothetical protein